MQNIKFYITRKKTMCKKEKKIKIKHFYKTNFSPLRK